MKNGGSTAQPLATKERYGCGVPLAGKPPPYTMRFAFVRYNSDRVVPSKLNNENFASEILTI